MKKQRQENVLAGLVGAFLGSLLGVACIVIVGQLGYVAAISGLVMAVCSIKGYELLGGRISRKGAIIACLLTILMTYLGNKLDFAIAAAQFFEVDIFTAFRAVDDLLEEEILNVSAYWSNLGMLYLFTLIGAVPTLVSAFRSAKSTQTPPQNAQGSAYMPQDTTYSQGNPYTPNPNYSQGNSYTPNPNYSQGGSYAPDPTYSQGGSYAPDPTYSQGGSYAPDPTYSQGNSYTPNDSASQDPYNRQ